MRYMGFSLVRVDNRLVHGQILESWIPFIKASCIVIVDDDVASDSFRESVIKMAVPSEIEIVVKSVRGFSENYSCDARGDKRTIVLFCNVCDALKAYRHGFKFEKLNIGNIHSGNGRKRCTSSVYLSERDFEDLRFLVEAGVKVELMSLPKDRPVDFRDVMQKMCFDVI